MLKIILDITLHQGMPDDLVQSKHFDPSNPSLIVFYLMRTVINDDTAAYLLTEAAHHRNISVVFFIQNLFFKLSKVEP